MVMGVSRVTSNANVSSCQNAYQANVLAYTAFQSDYAGSPPGEISNLSKLGYLDANLLNNPNFSLQFGVYRITRYEQTATNLIVDFTATWLNSSQLPPAYVDSSVLITGINESIDGRYQASSTPTFLAGNSYQIQLSVTGATPIVSTSVLESNPPVSISILSESRGSAVGLERSFETYVFDSQKARVSSSGPAMLAPSACAYLK
jgi:hypothetical protein